MSMSEVDAAAIERFKHDLADMDLDEIDQEICVAQGELDEIEPWLEALHAWKRKLKADSAEALEK